MGSFNVLDLFSPQEKEIFCQERQELISASKLVPSEDNFYSVENIEELAASIEMFGILQPLVVIQIADTDKYCIKAGHRRYTATKLLLSEGKNQFEMLPCTVKQPMSAALETLMLIQTNSTARGELSGYEKMEQAERARAALLELKNNGAQLPGRIRDHIAAMLKTSPAQVAKLDATNSNLIDPLKEKFKANEMNAATAYELSGLAPSQQQEAAKRMARGEKMNIDAAREMKAHVHAVPSAPAKAENTLQPDPQTASQHKSSATEIKSLIATLESIANDIENGSDVWSYDIHGACRKAAAILRTTI